MSLERAALITRLAEPLAASLGIAIWGVEIVGSSRPVARVFVDTVHGAVNPPADVPLDESVPTESVPNASAPDSSAPDSSAPDSSTQGVSVLDASGPDAASGDDDAPFDESDAFAEDDAFAEGGVTIDQCARLSRMLGLSLEVEETFADAWTLEVSSPGLERVFFKPAQLAPYVGRLFEVTLHLPHPDFSGRKRFRGTLGDASPQRLRLVLAAADHKADEPEEVVFAWEDARKVQLIHLFPAPAKTGKQVKPGKGGRGQTPGAGEASGGHA